MKFVIRKMGVFFLLVTVLACNDDKKLTIQELKEGTFAIEGEPDVVIVRKDTLQIEKYKNDVEIDSFSIKWLNDSIYTLKAIRPKTIIDTDIITYKIKKIDKNGYTFESVIGKSNYIQKGRIYKK